MGLIHVDEQKFFLLHTFSRTSDSFVVAGIFSKKDEADLAADEFRHSEKHANVACVQLLPMSEILNLLMHDRLDDLAKSIEPLVKLAAFIKSKQ